ncbi:MAG TPA: M17 family peptidase N-terminal domain-containing protein, partial [Gaiellaceae bacterium]|nr:M17 family peptidase N-terminal domain-containing protein [Gaiellaceae bacterium]
MEVSVSGPDSLAVEARVVAFAVRDGAAGPEPLGQRVRALLDEDGFRAQPGNAVMLHLPPDAGVERVAVGGLGTEIDADAIRTAAGAVARLVQPAGGTLAWVLDDSLQLSAAQQACAAVDGLLLGAYDPGIRKTEDRKAELERVVFVGGDDSVLREAERALVVARWTNRARDLANEPPNALTPARLAE